MAIHRRFLYAGLFLVAVGAVMLAADLAQVDDAALREALRLWPLAFIALGLGVVTRRTQFGLPAGILAAVAPGLLLGGSLVAGPRVAWECTDSAVPPATLQRDGNLSPGAAISLSTGCGTTHVSTAAGNAWHVSAGTTDGRDPEVEIGPTSLSVESQGRGGRQLVLGDRREAWDIVLPTTAIDLLSMVANANRMDVELSGGNLGAIVIEANASTVRLDATGSVVDTLDADISLGSASILLPATTHLTGHITVHAGSLRLCQPIGTGLTVEFTDDGAREVTVGGVRWSAEVWRSESDVLSRNQIELTVDATLASVDINPIGGC